MSFQIFLLKIHVFISIMYFYVCVACANVNIGAGGIQKESDLLKLELEVALAKLWSSTRVMCSLSPWTISQVLEKEFHGFLETGFYYVALSGLKVSM